MNNSGNEDLAREAKLWDDRELTPAGWQDAGERTLRSDVMDRLAGVLALQ